MKKFKVCKCGSEKFYMQQKISGYCNFVVDNNNDTPTENYDLHEGLLYKNCWKYYKCINCGRRAKEVNNV